AAFLFYRKQSKKNVAASKASQNRSRLLFHGFIRLWLRNSKSHCSATRLPLLSMPRIAPLSVASLVDWEPFRVALSTLKRKTQMFPMFFTLFISLLSL
ncbi:MAG: hypothetical protein VZR04_01185, partial [Succiniclasticum sp.]|nr:hypothetical protein [Succiniclasticum sp.]